MVVIQQGGASTVADGILPPKDRPEALRRVWAVMAAAWLAMSIAYYIVSAVVLERRTDSTVPRYQFGYWMVVFLVIGVILLVSII